MKVNKFNKDVSIEKLPPSRCPDLKIANTMNVDGVFDKYNMSPNVKGLYIARFGKIPHLIEINGINCKKAHEWFIKTYRNEIKDNYFSRAYSHSGNIREVASYLLFDDLMIYMSKYDEYDEVLILYKETDSALVETLVSEIRKFKKKSRRKYIGLLVSGSEGLDTRNMKITKPRFLIEENYNDNFLSIHQTILNRLRKKNDKGLVLLHGKPGTGKTTYIRYLITKIQKNVIFLPPNMAASITDPGLMNVLMDHPNSVFVIEDAENIIIDRNCGGSSSVSALLNLADGLLSDCLNIQIICSFNTDISRVDSALTRKGRLIAKYEFSELETPKAQALSNKLGFSSVVASPMTLSAVYNQHETDFSTPPRRKIGF